MRSSLSGRRLAVAAAVAAVTVGSGVAYAATNAITSTTQDVVASTSGSRTLGTDGGVPTTVLKATLPAGSWVLTLHASVVNFGASDYTRCMLFRGTTNLGGATATVGDPAQSGAAGPAALVSTVSFAKGLTLPGAATVSVQCSHDSTNGAAPYLDGGASLVAHKSSSLVVLSQ